MVTTYISDNLIVGALGEESPEIDRVMSGICHVENSPKFKELIMAEFYIIVIIMAVCTIIGAVLGKLI